jgi:hypothetical protein
MQKNKSASSIVIPTLVVTCCAVFLMRLNLSVSAQDEYTYSSERTRNPFLPLVTPDGRLVKLAVPKGETVLTVEGIIYDKNASSFAIVNGTVVKIGDTIEECRVLKIEENKVVFIKEGKSLEVEMKKGGE